MRPTFFQELYTYMSKDPNIIALTCDLGYGGFDKIRDEFEGRQFFNVGAAEQAGMDIAVGLAYSGKIPVIYSITPFLLYRPFETLRTYIDHERLAVKLVGSGRGDDYKHDGFSHDASDDTFILNVLPSIKKYHPYLPESIPGLMEEFIYSNEPSYLNLKK